MEVDDGDEAMFHPHGSTLLSYIQLGTDQYKEESSQAGINVFHCFVLFPPTFRLKIPDYTSDHHQTTNSNQDPHHGVHSNERSDQQPLGFLQVFCVNICPLVHPGEGEDQLETARDR